MDLDPAGAVLNGVFVLNVSLDLSQYPYCRQLMVSLFDSVYGSVKNVSVTGFINITNLNASLFQSLPMLSTFFGRVSLLGNQRDLSKSDYL